MKEIKTAKCGGYRDSAAQVDKHEIHCRKCALKYAGRTP